MFALWKKSVTNLDSILKSRHYFAKKCPSSQSYGFSSSHVWIWEFNYTDSWAPKNLCLWTVLSGKTLGSPFDWKEIQPVKPKGNQSWIFSGGTDAEAEIPILWLPDAKKWLIWKDPVTGEDWRWEEKETTEEEMLDGITNSTDMRLSKFWSWGYTGKPHAVVHGVAMHQTRLRDWTELRWRDRNIIRRGISRHIKPFFVY